MRTSRSESPGAISVASARSPDRPRAGTPSAPETGVDSGEIFRRAQVPAFKVAVHALEQEEVQGCREVSDGPNRARREDASHDLDVVGCPELRLVDAHPVEATVDVAETRHFDSSGDEMWGLVDPSRTEVRRGDVWSSCKFGSLEWSQLRVRCARDCVDTVPFRLEPPFAHPSLSEAATAARRRKLVVGKQSFLLRGQLRHGNPKRAAFRGRFSARYARRIAP